MTKTIVIVPAKEKKPIKFVKSLDFYGAFSTNCQPTEYKYVELVATDYHKGCDLMFAYNNPDERSNGIAYLGYWNDGIVQIKSMAFGGENKVSPYRKKKTLKKLNA